MVMDTRRDAAFATYLFEQCGVPAMYMIPIALGTVSCRHIEPVGDLICHVFMKEINTVRCCLSSRECVFEPGYSVGFARTVPLGTTLLVSHTDPSVSM